MSYNKYKYTIYFGGDITFKKDAVMAVYCIKGKVYEGKCILYNKELMIIEHERVVIHIPVKDIKYIKSDTI